MVFTWRILIFVFCFGLLAVPPEDMNFEDAPLYFVGIGSAPLLRGVNLRSIIWQ